MHLKQPRFIYGAVETFTKKRRKPEKNTKN